MFKQEHKHFLLVVVCLFVLLRHCHCVQKCDYNAATCGCMTEAGEINLKPLSKSEPYAADFQLKNEKFYWDPCKDFTLGTITAGAIQVQVPVLYYDIGVHANAGSQVDSQGQPMFTLMAQDGMRSSYITCICAGETSFQFEKEDPLTNYHFTLKSGWCCPGHKDDGGGDGALSVGSIMLIIFFVLLIAYFALGTVFQVTVRKASGHEKIPNYMLWSQLPGLIKDGFKFTVSCGKKSSYTNI